MSDEQTRQNTTIPQLDAEARMAALTLLKHVQRGSGVRVTGDDDDELLCIQGPFPVDKVLYSVSKIRSTESLVALRLNDRRLAIGRQTGDINAVLRLTGAPISKHVLSALQLRHKPTKQPLEVLPSERLEVEFCWPGRRQWNVKRYWRFPDSVVSAYA